MPGTLALARALRHLKRRVPSRTQRLLDEEATVRHIVDTDDWSPVQKAAPARWLDVMLVIDESSSMVVWGQLISEFHQLLERQGAFRTIRRWYMASDRVAQETGLYAQRLGAARRHPTELLDPQGQRLILVLSDCVSRGWYDGSVAALLNVWSAKGMVALIQMLPQAMWQRTALRTGAQRYLRSNQPGLVNAKLKQRTVLVKLYPTEADLRRVAHDAGIALDRVPLSGSAINNWDGLLTEAAKNQQVADLLDVARQEYSSNDQLAAAQADWAANFAPGTTPLSDNGLVLLNFGRELSAAQHQQIEKRLGEQLHNVIVATRFDDDRPYGPQCIALLDDLGWTQQEWETRPLLVIPPGFAPVALTLISLLHGRRGHFPAVVCAQIPNGVICLLSALRFHNLTTQLPFEIWLALENKAWKPQIEEIAVRYHWFSGLAFTQGVEIHPIEGIDVKVYNPAKTVADCFKYRNKIGLDIAIEALRDGWQQQRFTVDELWHHAKICRVQTIIRPYMEAIL